MTAAQPARAGPRRPAWRGPLVAAALLLLSVASRARAATPAAASPLGDPVAGAAALSPGSARGAAAGSTTATLGPKIVVLAGHAGDRLAERVRAELETLGYRAEIVLTAELGPGRHGLEAEAGRLGAIALVSVPTRGRSVEIWIADRATGKTALSATVVAPPGTGSRDDILALRAVELLRTSLLDPGGGDQARGSVSPPADAAGLAGREPWASGQVRAAARPLWAAPARAGEEARQDDGVPQPPALLFGVAGTGVFGLTRQAHALLGFEWLPGDRFGVGGQLLVPVRATELEGQGGHATVDGALFALGPRVRVLGDGDPWLWTLGVDLGAALLEVRGYAEPPLVPGSDRLTVFSGYVDTTVSVGVSPRLRLAAMLLFGGVAPSPVIRFSGQEVTTWGAPLYSLALGAMINP